jgi:acetyl-CoA C-acetyltransferase
MRKVYIVGVGSTTFGKHSGESIESLAVAAAVDALLESTVDREQIGALYLGNFISGPLNGKEGLCLRRYRLPTCLYGRCFW